MRPMDKLNRDGNLLGRLCALAVIVAAVMGVGRITGYCPSACPFAGSGHCFFGR